MPTPKSCGKRDARPNLSPMMTADNGESSDDSGDGRKGDSPAPLIPLKEEDIEPTLRAKLDKERRKRRKKEKKKQKKEKRKREGKGSGDEGKKKKKVKREKKEPEDMHRWAGTKSIAFKLSSLNLRHSCKCRTIS